QLPRNIERFFVGKIADALNQRAEVFSIDVLHREKVLTLELCDVIHAADIRVRQLPRDADLREKPLAPHRIGAQGAWKKLERDGLSQLQVVGPIDFTHAAASKQADNAVALRENSSRCEA